MPHNISISNYESCCIWKNRPLIFKTNKLNVLFPWQSLMNDWLEQPTNLLLFVTSCICVINSASERSFALSQRVIFTMLHFKQQYKSINFTYSRLKIESISSHLMWTFMYYIQHYSIRIICELIFIIINEILVFI